MVAVRQDLHSTAPAARKTDETRKDPEGRESGRFRFDSEQRQRQLSISAKHARTHFRPQAQSNIWLVRQAPEFPGVIP